MASPMDLTEEKNGGLLKTVLKEGTGEERPGKGDTVIVHYVGTLEADGSQFDSSRERGEEFSFTLGRGQVIKGWDLGVASMRKGELATLNCSPDFGYGANGSPPKIPPAATLKFEVELIRWEGEDISVERDHSITRSMKVEGAGPDSPNDGASVTIDIAGTCDGKSFLDKKGLSFPVGECSEHGLPDGVDKALKRFKKGEQSLITLKPKAGFGAKGRADLGVPPNADLSFTIRLVDFVKEKDSWQMDDAEKLAAAEAHKARGTTFFQAGKLKMAAAKYAKIKDLLQHVNSLEGAEKEKRDALVLAAHLNLALVYVKKGEALEAAREADAALELSPDHPKALYRRAAARELARDFEAAAADYRHLLSIEPDNKAAAQGIAKAKAQIAAEKKVQIKTFGGMFDKFAKIDAKKVKPVPVPSEEKKEVEEPVKA